MNATLAALLATFLIWTIAALAYAPARRFVRWITTERFIEVKR